MILFLKADNNFKKSNIYSFAIIAYELFANVYPYTEYRDSDDLNLVLRVCRGMRPNLEEVKIPRLLKDLIKSCWDADSLQRPMSDQLEKCLLGWRSEVINGKDTEFSQQYWKLKEADKSNKAVVSTASDLTYQTHPQAIYTSCLLDFKNLPEPQNSNEINEPWNSKGHDISQPAEFSMTKLQETLEEVGKQENNDNGWATLGPVFTSELVQHWQSLGFASLQAKEWLNIGLQSQDHNLASWLRDTKNLTSEEVLNYGDLETLNQEFFTEWQQIETPPK